MLKKLEIAVKAAKTVFHTEVLYWTNELSLENKTYEKY